MYWTCLLSNGQIRHFKGLIADKVFLFNFGWMKHISIRPKRKPSWCLVRANYLHRSMNLWNSGSASYVKFNGLSERNAFAGGAFTLMLTCLSMKLKDRPHHSCSGWRHSNSTGSQSWFYSWITKQYGNGAEVASLCIGALIWPPQDYWTVENATHWWLPINSERCFWKLTGDRTNYHWWTGFVFQRWSFLLHESYPYLIEKYAGREIAILSAKVFAIEIDRHTQSPFIMFQGQKEHNDEPIRNAQTFIENNFQEKITVDELASMLALGRRNLERRFKKATSNTVIEYIQRVKIEAAKKSFETTRKNINEIMYDVGYSDTKAFRTVFRKITGLSPIEYRTKYNKEALAYKWI